MIWGEAGLMVQDWDSKHWMLNSYSTDNNDLFLSSEIMWVFTKTAKMCLCTGQGKGPIPRLDFSLFYSKSQSIFKYTDRCWRTSKYKLHLRQTIK